MSTKKLAVLGNPIAHSLSPQMHNAWIADHGLDAIYERVLIEGGDEAFAAYIKSAALFGANVTVPFKAAAYAAATARNAGEDVANVLTWRADGSIRADNTDGEGFLAALDESAPGWRAPNVLIVGAGGAAVGIARTLAKAPRSLVIANRTQVRAEALAATVPGEIKVSRWEDLPAQFARADLIVQTTTLGMNGGEAGVWPLERCRPEAVIVDIVYRPLITPLLRAAAARGLKTVDGLGMLIHQGALAFEIWFGIKPDVKKARARLMAILEGGA